MRWVEKLQFLARGCCCLGTWRHNLALGLSHVVITSMGVVAKQRSGLGERYLVPVKFQRVLRSIDTHHSFRFRRRTKDVALDVCS